MNKTKVALGLTCVVAIAALAYNQIQTQPLEPVLQVTKGKVLNQAPTKSTEHTRLERGTAENSQLSAPPSIPSPSVGNVPVGTPIVQSNNKASVQARSHNKPADHSGASQPKHHGHEHAQQKRHAEDNSIIPPGEPKKPLPEKNNNN